MASPHEGPCWVASAEHVALHRLARRRVGAGGAVRRALVADLVSGRIRVRIAAVRRRLRVVDRVGSRRRSARTSCPASPSTHRAGRWRRPGRRLRRPRRWSCYRRRTPRCSRSRSRGLGRVSGARERRARVALLAGLEDAVATGDDMALRVARAGDDDVPFARRYRSLRSPDCMTVTAHVDLTARGARLVVGVVAGAEIALFAVDGVGLEIVLILPSPQVGVVQSMLQSKVSSGTPPVPGSQVS